eukprot:365319-Chlamydomonas_euryale.AAC.17
MPAANDPCGHARPERADLLLEEAIGADRPDGRRLAVVGDRAVRLVIWSGGDGIGDVHAVSSEVDGGIGIGDVHAMSSKFGSGDGDGIGDMHVVSSKDGGGSGVGEVCGGDVDINRLGSSRI